MSPPSTIRLAALLALIATLLPHTHATDTDVAVSLNSFTPRLSDLPSTCDAVYRREITGCTPDDFLSKDCSTSCINGLVSIQKAVQEACKDADVESNSVIGVFRAGSGIPYVCDNVVVTTLASSTVYATATPSATSQQVSSSAAEEQPQSSATSQPQQSQSQSQTTQPPSSATPNPSSGSGSGSSTPSSTGGVAIDTSVPSTFATSQGAGATSTDGAQDPHSTNTQKSNQDSGGGSPFDVQAVSGSVSLRIRGAAWGLLAVAVLVYGVL